MKLSLIFPLVFTATTIKVSPILFHYLCSNGYMSPSDKIESLLNSPSEDQELVQIVIAAQAFTRLILPVDSKASSIYEYNSESAERSCFQSILEKANAIRINYFWFKQISNCVESNVYYYFLYWTKRDFEFLASITPHKNKALTIVLQNLYGKVERLFEEFLEIYAKAPHYSKFIMSEYKANSFPAAPLPPFDFKWAKSVDFVEPKVHYLLLYERLRLKTIDSKFIASAKDIYHKAYQAFIKNKGDNGALNGLRIKNTPSGKVKLLNVGCSIHSSWLAFWLLAMRIRRPMPSLSETALGPCLIESFKLENKAMAEISKENYMPRKYALKCSCLHINYLMTCMQTALLFNLLNYQEHATCFDLILTHRTLALEMIENIAQRGQ